MIDYARESFVDFSNILYEFDDINSFDFVAALEKTEGESKPVQTENPVSKVDDKSDDNKTSDSGSNAGTPKEGEDADNNKNPNTNLKSTSAFVARIKELADTLAEKIKTAISKLSDKLKQLQAEEIDRFLQAANEAKNKNGFNAIEIENVHYDPTVFNNAVADVKAIIDSVKNRIDSVCAEYSRASSGSADNENNGIKKFNEEYGDNKVFSMIAGKVGLPTTGGADAKSVNNEFQAKFRGEKTQFKLTEQYVEECITYLRQSVGNARKLVEASNSSRDAAKLITDKSKVLRVNPDTSGELNDEFTKFFNNAAKIIVYAASFWILAYNLSLECRQNCRIVIQRAYKMDDKSANVKKVNTEAKTENTNSENTNSEGNKETNNAQG